MGGRMRMIVAELEVVRAPQPMPKLPVARALWRPQPDFQRACQAWILAGGAHHAGFSQALTVSHLEDFAGMAGVEFIHIGADTNMSSLQKELFWNDAAYRLAR
jgi:L-arabinose isomerase